MFTPHNIKEKHKKDSSRITVVLIHKNQNIFFSSNLSRVRKISERTVGVWCTKKDHNNEGKYSKSQSKTVSILEKYVPRRDRVLGSVAACGIVNR